MDMIIPAAGSASRMNGIPKYLLPIDSKGQSLLSRHIEAANEYVEHIWIPTREAFLPLLSSISEMGNVSVLTMDTKTMSETILETVKYSKSNQFLLTMPDTYFLNQSPIPHLAKLDGHLSIAIWKIRESQKGKLGQIAILGNQVIDLIDKDPNCDYEYSWGAISFSREFLMHLDPEMPHIGYAIPSALNEGLAHNCVVIDGEYFDCGTPDEYFDLIRKIS